MAETKVLIVDDDALVAFHLQKSLISLGYKVAGLLASGEDAVAEVTKNPPDLILMDVRLRDKLNGIEAAEMILEQVQIPIIYITAYSDDAMIEQARRSQPYGYLVKPIKENDLHATIEMALYKSKMDQQLKNLYQVLYDSEERFRRLFEDAPLSYQSVDNKGVILDVNNSWVEMLGYSREEAIGRWFGDFVAPEGLRKFKVGFQNFMKAGETISQHRVVHKNGDVLVIAFNGKCANDSQGNFKQTHCILTNITERVRTEEELHSYREHLEELVKSRTRELDAAISMLNATLESTNDGILVTSLDGVVVKWNQRFLKMFGVDESNLAGTSFQLFLKRIQDGFVDKKTSLAQFRDLIDRADGEGSMIIDCKENKIYECFLIPQIMDGKMVGKVWNFSDVTLQRQLEVELTLAKNIAEKASRAKTEFLANMSHEIRTPMNAVIGFADLLDRKVTDERLRTYVSSIKTSGRALLQIINDILDISKIEAGRMEIQSEPIRLDSVFTEIKNMFSMKVAEKGIRLHTDIPDDFPWAIVIDELRLRQVLLNVVGNAVKFTDKGKVHLRASFKKLSGDFIALKIEVQDSGIGIESDYLDKIFEAFIQQETQDHKKFGGTGLGLFISKRLTELMGGTISVKSQHGKGSTFSLNFPEIKVQDRNRNPVEVDAFDFESVWFDGQVILIVDDVETNRHLVKSMLMDRNLILVEAQNGLEAIKMAKVYKPDFVFMDLRMPVMGGIEATQTMKKDPVMKRIPVIAITASTVEFSKFEREYSGLFDGFLRKPVVFEDILGILIQFIDFEFKAPNDLLAKAPVKKRSSKKK